MPPAPSRPRDFQRSRVYAAEEFIPRACRGHALLCLDEIQAYAMRVTQDPGFCRRFPERPGLADDIVVDECRYNQTRALCFSHESRMTFPQNRTRECELLHEITHAALATGVGHRQEFVEGFQWMLGRFLPKAAPHFYEACRELGVKSVPATLRRRG